MRNIALTSIIVFALGGAAYGAQASTTDWDWCPTVPKQVKPILPPGLPGPTVPLPPPVDPWPTPRQPWVDPLPRPLPLPILGLRVDQPSIQLPDGISYEVLSSRTVVLPDAGHCGFNDVSMPNAAKYRIETRRYSQHAKGRLIRTWTETASVFVECVHL